ncbi:MAG TPA: hypothetical protein VGF23_21300 [Gaiellaceae bacterium]|jgi:hypothetical protein
MHRIAHIATGLKLGLATLMISLIAIAAPLAALAEGNPHGV